jgi:hypothetical protein
MYGLISFVCLLIFFNLAVAQDLKIITPEGFIAENPTPERKDILDFITKQF